MTKPQEQERTPHYLIHHDLPLSPPESPKSSPTFKFTKRFSTILDPPNDPSLGDKALTKELQKLEEKLQASLAKERKLMEEVYQIQKRREDLSTAIHHLTKARALAIYGSPTNEHVEVFGTAI